MSSSAICGPCRVTPRILERRVEVEHAKALLLQFPAEMATMITRNWPHRAASALPRVSERDGARRDVDAGLHVKLFERLFFPAEDLSGPGLAAFALMKCLQGVTPIAVLVALYRLVKFAQGKHIYSRFHSGVVRFFTTT